MAISFYVITSDSHELCEQMHCEITKRQCLENYSGPAVYRPRLVFQLVIIVFTWLIYDIGYACRERSMSLQIGPAIPAFPLALGDVG